MEVASTVTVIVPVYNVENYIRKCLSSLLKQSYRNFQIFVISDGSTDKSMEIAQEISKSDSRVKTFFKENGGYGSVLEYAIQSVDTEYFMICDPDDWLDYKAIESLYMFAQSHKLDLVIGDKYEVFTNTGKKEYIKSFKNIEPKKIFTDSADIQRLAFGEASPHAKLFRTSIAKNISFPHHVSYTDTVLYVVSLLNSQRVAYYNESLAYYLIDRPGNSMTVTNEKKLIDLIAVINSIFDQILKYDNKQDIILYYLYFLLIQFLNESSQYPSFLKENNYRQEVIKLLEKLLPYKKNIYLQIAEKNKSNQKFLFKALMNKSTRTHFINLYVFYMSKKLH